MVRYTQDTLDEQRAEPITTNLWGDDPFPAVDSNWDQPAKSLVVQLNHNVGSKGVNTLSRSRTPPTRSPSTAAGRTRS